jgi:uncharacterized membrane protein
MRAIVEWAQATWLHDFVVAHGRLWPALECLHYLGLALLFGTVALYDLRVLGLAKAVPISALHRLVPFGVAGFAINAITGSMFFAGAPDQYVYNAAFKAKVALLALAGVNVVVFYSWAFASVRELGQGVDAPGRAKIAAGVSLLAWTGVMVAGRLLTFYRP